MNNIEEVNHILNEWYLDFTHIGMRDEANVYRKISSILVNVSNGTETPQELQMIRNFLATCRAEFKQSLSEETDFIASCISNDIATLTQIIRKERVFVYSSIKSILEHRETRLLEVIIEEYF